MRMFQSLFCWIRDSDSIWLVPCNSSNLGFNPCSVGLGIQTIRRFVVADFVPEFQSLFCWIRDSDTQIFKREAMHVLFQSLFCWIRDSDRY